VRLLLLLAFFLGASLSAHAESSAEAFRRGNEHASRGRWDKAISEYDQLARAGIKAPSLYWNWAQVATSQGRKGEAIWALQRAQELAPRDVSVPREIERLRAELGLDPSEISLGAFGDLRRVAARYRFDALAILFLALSVALLVGTNPRRPLSLGVLVLGLFLLAPYLLGGQAEARGVVVQKDAPLMDAPGAQSLALANLREGEVVPILEAEGDFVKIQDASGARGFANKNDVRRIGVE
jgi:tetratricopeptide (TPR) repeat protein